MANQQDVSFAVVTNWAPAALGASFTALPSSSPWVLTNNDGDSVHQLEWEVQEAGTTLVSINAPCGGAHILTRAVGGLGLNTQFRPAGNARVSCLIKAGSGDGAGLVFGYLDPRNFFYFATSANLLSSPTQW